MLTTTLATGLWVLTPGVALAAGNAACGGATGVDPNEHDGGFRAVTAVGMEAKIETQSPLLCTGASSGYSGSFAYVSVEVSGGLSSIIQIGVGRCVAPAAWSFCTGQLRYWYAWGRTNGVGSCTSDHPAVPVNLGAATAGTHTYTVYKTATQVIFKIDGVTKTTLGLGNVSCWTSEQDYVSVTGETLDHGDQMGGDPGDRLKLSNAVYEATVGGAWLSPSFSVCDSSFPEIYSCSRINGQAVDIWTDRS